MTAQYNNFSFTPELTNYWNNLHGRSYRYTRVQDMTGLFRAYSTKDKKNFHITCAYILENYGYNPYVNAAYFLNNNNYVYNIGYIVDFITYGVEKNYFNLEEKDQRTALAHVFKSSSKTMVEVLYNNRFKILKKLIAADSSYIELLADFLKEFDKSYPFDITFKNKLKQYVDSLNIEASPHYPDIKKYWQELEQEDFLTTNYYLVYNSHIDLNILASMKKLKNQHIQSSICPALKIFNNLLQRREIFNTPSCNVELIKVENEVWTVAKIGFNYTVKDQKSRDDLEKGFTLFINQICDDVSKNPVEYNTDNVKALVNALVLKHFLTNELKEQKIDTKRNKI